MNRDTGKRLRCSNCRTTLAMPPSRCFIDRSDAKLLESLFRESSPSGRLASCRCGNEQWAPFLYRDSATGSFIFVVDGDRRTLMTEYESFLQERAQLLPHDVFEAAWGGPYFVVAGTLAFRALLGRLADIANSLPKVKPAKMHPFGLVTLLQVAAAYRNAGRHEEAFGVLQKLRLPAVPDPDYLSEYALYAVAVNHLQLADRALTRAAEESRLQHHMPIDFHEVDAPLVAVPGIRLSQLRAAVTEKKDSLKSDFDLTDDELAHRAGVIVGSIQAALIDLTPTSPELKTLTSLKRSMPGIYRRWLQETPSRVAATEHLMSIYTAAKESARGVLDLSANPEYLLKVGDVLINSEDEDVARQALSQAEEAGTGEVKLAAAQRIGAMCIQSEPDKAERWFQLALRARDSTTLARTYLGLALLSIGRRDAARYTDFLTESAKVGSRGGSPEALYLLAIDELEKGNNNRYESYLVQLTRHDYGVTSEAAAVALAQVYFDKGDLNSAYEAAMSASESLDVGILSGSMYYRGAVFALIGREQEARRLLGAVVMLRHDALSVSARSWLDAHPDG